jgi:hypothetical protein
MLQRRLALAADRDDGRLFFGPRGGRVSTAILRDANHWDDVVASLGFDRLPRHDLRHTGGRRRRPSRSVPTVGAVRDLRIDRRVRPQR